MNKLCPNCGFINFSGAIQCQHCQCDLTRVAAETSARRAFRKRTKLLRRLAWTPVLIFGLLLGFYASLLRTSDPLPFESRVELERALGLLEQRGFKSEVFILRRVATFRANDNWLNRYAGHENAYASVNFPFQIVTLYPDFFDKTQDDTERAAILLHEAQHLYGADEAQAYEYVWRKRQQIGWTQEIYKTTRVWNNVLEATRSYVPRIFQCGLEQNEDCTD
jgi:hypothetical protein